MGTIKIATLVHLMDKYPLETLIVRRMIHEGIDSNEKLREFLKLNDNGISRVTINKLENTMQDFNSGYYDNKGIPLIKFEL